MMNKKGEGNEGSILIYLLLALAAAILVGYFLYTIFFTVNDAIDGQGIQTTNMIASCQKDLFFAKTDDLKYTTYCGNFRAPFEVGKKASYVNCEYLVRRSVAAFTLDELPQTVRNMCSLTVSNKLAYQKCVEFNSTHTSQESWTEYINGVKCTRTTSYTAFGLTEAQAAGSKPAESSLAPGELNGVCLADNTCNANLVCLEQINMCVDELEVKP